MKKVTFNLYTPKELWTLFCNWVFWPRHKKCADWCDYYDGVLCKRVSDILKNEIDNGSIGYEVAERIEIAIKTASEKVAKTTADLMSEQYKFEYGD